MRSTTCVTLVQLRAYVLDNPDPSVVSSRDTLLTQVGDDASDEFERMTGRRVKKRVGLVERPAGTGCGSLFTRVAPVLSIASLNVDTLTLIEGTDFILDETLGHIQLFGERRFPTGFGRIVLTYNAGWEDGDIPGDITSLVLRLAKVFFDARTTGASVAQSIKVGENAFSVRTGLPMELKQAIDRWRDTRF